MIICPRCWSLVTTRHFWDTELDARGGAQNAKSSLHWIDLTRMQPSGSVATGQSRPGRSALSWSLTLGLAVFAVLIVAYGVRDVALAFAAAGGAGIVVVTLSHLVPLTAHAIGWRVVLAGEHRPPLRTFVWGRWLAESVNDLLPVLQVGGAVVRGRALVGTGVAATTAGASVVVDITLMLSTQVVFTLIGLSLLIVYLGANEVAGQVIIGVGLTTAALGSFVLLQRRGLFGLMARLLERLAHTPDWLTLVSSAAAFDGEIHRLYRNRPALTAASAWHLLAWPLSV